METKRLINIRDLTSIISKNNNNMNDTIIIGKHKINERKLTKKYTRHELGIRLFKKKDQTIHPD
jgi:hypothetical protein